MVTGVLRRPRATLRQVAEAPAGRSGTRTAALLAGLTAAAAATNAALLSTVVGQQALVDQWERTALAFGQAVDDSRYAGLQTLSERGALYGIGSAAVNVPLVILIAAVAIYLAFGRPLPPKAGPGPKPPGEGGFRTVLAVVTYTGVILVLRVIVSAPLAYIRETTASATSLGVWFPAFDEAAPLARLLGLIDLFAIWWVVVLAIGVSVLYQRPATRMAMVFVGIYAGLAAALALVMAALGGTLS
jgi:hypothetical protein